ncbi:MAG: beta-galactosidase trimerization domain-containing protein [Elusimicrobiota bacterium]
MNKLIRVVVIAATSALLYPQITHLFAETAIAVKKADAVVVNKTGITKLAKGQKADWNKIVPITGFYLNNGSGNLAVRQTEVRVTYDDNALFVQFKCEEPEPRKIEATVTINGSNVWKDDCVEVFLSPSPLESFHWVLNTKNVVYVNHEVVTEDQTGKTSDEKWKGNFKTSTKIDKTFWTADFVMPFTDFGGINDEYRINFTRQVPNSMEQSTWSPIRGKFNQPERFATLSFKHNYIERLDYGDMEPTNYGVKRDRPVFDEVLYNEPGNYACASWNHDIRTAQLPQYMQEQFKKDPKAYEKHLRSYLDQQVECGMLIPHGSSAIFNEYRKKYNAKSWLMVETSPVAAVAEKKGSPVIHPAAGGRKRLFLADPVYVDVVIEALKNIVTTHKETGAVYVYRGVDEPTLSPAGPEFIDIIPFWINAQVEVKEKYGYGKYGIPVPSIKGANVAKGTKFVTTKPDTDTLLSWLAYNRWASDKFVESRIRMRDALKSIDPTALWQPCDYWFMGGLSMYDYWKMAQTMDLALCDPYTTSADEAHGRTRGRGIYNHGFGTKFLNDIGGKPVWTIMQAFFYDGYKPLPEDIREWASQCMKTGAVCIEYYASDAPMVTDPPRWEMMKHVSKTVTTMKKIKFPEKTSTAIFVSQDTNLSEVNSIYADELYTIYAWLGEKLGVWFRFIADDKILDGADKLEDYKIIYVPYAWLQREEVVKRLRDWTSAGGTLVVGDSKAFTLAPDGTSLAKYQEELFGVQVGDENLSDALVGTGTDALKSMKAGQKFVLYKPQRRSTGWTNTAVTVKVVDPKATVAATLSDGNPGVVIRGFGKGKVVYFAANPFSPQSIRGVPGWEDVIKELEISAGEQFNLPIWRFMLPDIAKK